MVRHLQSDFRRLQRRRDAIGREGDARLRNVRALGELAKFRIVPFGSVLSRLKARRHCPACRHVASLLIRLLRPTATSAMHMNRRNVRSTLSKSINVYLVLAARE